jgi:UDP-3-O-[3-hydroxymyristoyl] glucosamine N-acyltransferase
MIVIKSKIREVKFGKNCKIIDPVNLYECELGDNVFVGPFVEITKGVKIGDNTRISSHSFICEFVTIGKDCFIAHGVMFTNEYGIELKNEELFYEPCIFKH